MPTLLTSTSSPPSRARHGAEELVDGGGVGDIGDEVRRRGRVGVDHHDPCAPAGERRSDGRADARPAARDQRPQSLKIVVHAVNPHTTSPSAGARAMGYS